MSLFIKERFKMHSGKWSDFKLECDGLTEQDYMTLAFLVSRKMRFCNVYGIPRGGVLFANCLNPYAVSDTKDFLIVDDVLTSGGSLLKARDELSQKHGDTYTYKGIVVFARGECLPWVTPIFTLNSLFYQADEH